MTSDRTYRCLSCLEHTVSRDFDTSHLSVTCPDCGSFERFVNERVFEQFEQFEASPPADLGWDRLERTEKLLISERVARTDRTIEDFSVEDVGAEGAEVDPAEDAGAEVDPAEDTGAEVDSAETESAGD